MNDLQQVKESMAELEAAGIVTQVLRPDGQIGYALTPFGELIATLTALDSIPELAEAGQ